MPSHAIRELTLLPQVVKLELGLRKKWIIKPSTFSIYRRKLASEVLISLNTIQEKHDRNVASALNERLLNKEPKDPAS